ncbi:MAG: efflux RND transporter periplasmic adaptor subunit [Ignavibacteriota bacterium]
MRDHTLPNTLWFFLLFMAVSHWGCSKSGTIHPQRKDIIETVYASGSIIPANEYTVFSQTGGTVLRKLVSDGDTVAKGQTLYEIRNDAQSSRLVASEAAYQNAVLNGSDNSPVLRELKLAEQSADSKFKTDSVEYERYKKLHADGIITKSQIDAYSSAYTVSLNQKLSTMQRYISTLHELKVGTANAQSAVAAAKNDLENSYIKADAGGVVYQTMKEMGEAVRLSEPVALLGEHDRMTIKLAVDQQDIEKIGVGQQVLLRSDITGNTVFEARVVKIYPVMNIADQTFRVDAEFISAPPNTFIHGSVEANIVVSKKDHALLIPRSLLLSGDSVRIKLPDGEKNIHVRTGIITLDDAEILSGLDERSELVDPNSK